MEDKEPIKSRVPIEAERVADKANPENKTETEFVNL